jgi:hypothetical protein
MVYASVRSDSTSERDVDNIIETAEYNNSQKAISGVILIKKNYFFQYFEGEAEVVDALYATLVVDPRHKDIKLIKRGYLDQPIFPGWGMFPIHAASSHDEYTSQIRNCVDKKLRDILITYCINERPINLLYDDKASPAV